MNQFSMPNGAAYNSGESRVGETVTASLVYVSSEYANAVEAKTGVRPVAADSLEAQLAEACADRDRYIARCAELELRLQRIREVVK